MAITEDTDSVRLVIQLHSTLMELARREADAAANEAAAVLRSEAARVMGAAS